MTELSKIAQNYLTDKGNTYINSHCYTEIYDQYFQKYKEENRKIYILEIGIQCGYDLLMLNDYFKGNCEIYGLDIDLSNLQVELPSNIHVFELDATNEELINNFLYENSNIISGIYNIPKFDIIIDDGSHQAIDIFKSLQIFYNKLSNDGIYIIEDLHADNESLYYLNFRNTNLDINLDNVTNKLASCIIYHNYNSYCIEYKPSICAILTFNK